MIAAWLVLLACTKSDECSEETPCGLGAVCVEGTCVEQNCSTSDQCPIEQYCSSARTCTTGCESDTDCRFGDVCDGETHTCGPTTCTSTRVDCGWGEFCSPAGECYDAGAYYCAPCNDDGDCGGGGNLCYAGYCGVFCDTDQDCPNGYDCVDFVDLSGNVISHQCYTACELFE